MITGMTSGRPGVTFLVQTDVPERADKDVCSSCQSSKRITTIPSQAPAIDTLASLTASEYALAGYLVIDIEADVCPSGRRHGQNNK
jgi:hypothetical protein